MYMKRIIRRIVAPTVSVMLALSLAACGSGENEPLEIEEPEMTEEYEEPVEEESYDEADAYEENEEAQESEEKEENEEPEETADELSYVPIYRELVSEMSESGMADQFMLAVIDDDEIPELLASNSEGPFDLENTFIYTVYDDEPVLLAGVIAGVDGASLSYSEMGMIRQTGGVTGQTEIYSSIGDGMLTEEFRAEMLSTLETDEEGDEVYSYSINGKEVTPEEYEKQLSEFAAEYAPFVSIDEDGLNVMEFKDGQFESMHGLAYWTAEDTFDMLDSIVNE